MSSDPASGLFRTIPVSRYSPPLLASVCRVSAREDRAPRWVASGVAGNFFPLLALVVLIVNNLDPNNLQITAT